MRAAVLAFIFLFPAASGYPESVAPEVRVAEGGPDDVEGVWHEPPVVEPGTQWEAFIRFRTGHSVEGVMVQICDVGRACFAPPTPMLALPDGRTWTVNTTDYRDTSGHPIRYEAGWRLGMYFILSERLANGSLASTGFPEGTADPLDYESHYLAFNMPAASSKGAPGTPIVLVALFLFAAAAAARRR